MFDVMRWLRKTPVLSSTFLLSAAILWGCTGTPNVGETRPPAPGTGGIVAAAPEAVEPPPPIHVTLIQLNDIYEITPVSGGRWGGPARVATVRRRLTEANPNTFTILAGDLFSPSALGTARVDGERLAGRQMVAVLNEMGLDLATFGNHEFDLNEAQFLSRMEESAFEWVSTNVTDDEGAPFPHVDKHEILTIRDVRGRALRLGFIGLCFDGIDPDYVEFLDPIQTARAEVEILRDSVDAIVAITHLPVEQDIALAQAVPELDIIIGGHEHENMRLFRGSDLTPILKADANVRTLYIHDLLFDPETGVLEIDSRLLPITVSPAAVAAVQAATLSDLDADASQPKSVQREGPASDSEPAARGLLSDTRVQVIMNPALQWRLKILGSGTLSKSNSKYPPSSVRVKDLPLRTKVAPMAWKMGGISGVHRTDTTP